MKLIERIFKKVKQQSTVKYSSCAGFTLLEILVTTAILAFCLTGLLATYVNMLTLGNLSQDLDRAQVGIEAKAEEIQSCDFDSLVSTYDNTSFDLNGFLAADSEAAIDVDATTYTDLLRVRIVGCFKTRGRIIGEDVNLNGQLDSGEDINPNNSRLDSPVEKVLLIGK